MKPFRSLLIAALLGAVSTVHAAPAGVYDFPAQITGVNPCTGESIGYTGSFRIVTTFSSNSNSLVTLHFTGTGSLGNRYVFQDEAHEATRVSADGSYTYRLNERTRVVSSTNAPNFTVTLVSTLTYNAATDSFSSSDQLDAFCSTS